MALLGGFNRARAGLQRWGKQLWKTFSSSSLVSLADDLGKTWQSFKALSGAAFAWPPQECPELSAPCGERWTPVWDRSAGDSLRQGLVLTQTVRWFEEVTIYIFWHNKQELLFSRYFFKTWLLLEHWNVIWSCFWCQGPLLTTVHSSCLAACSLRVPALERKLRPACLCHSPASPRNWHLCWNDSKCSAAKRKALLT